MLENKLKYFEKKFSWLYIRESFPSVIIPRDLMFLFLPWLSPDSVFPSLFCFSPNISLECHVSPKSFRYFSFWEKPLVKIGIVCCFVVFLERKIAFRGRTECQKNCFIKLHALKLCLLLEWQFFIVNVCFGEICVVKSFYIIWKREQIYFGWWHFKYLFLTSTTINFVK